MWDSAVDTLERSVRARPARAPTPPAASATALAVRKLRRPGCQGGRRGSSEGGPLRKRGMGRAVEGPDWAAASGSG